MVHPVDQVVLHRIGRRVDQLVHHRVAVGELHHADLFRRPEVLPAAPQRILAAREHLMEMLDEPGIPAAPIEHHGVIVMLIAHGSNTSISHRWAASIRQYVKALFVAGTGRSKNCLCVQRRVIM